MKNLVFSVLALTLIAVAGRPAGAMDSMHSSMMMPKCAAGDKMVGVNTMSKMYMTHDQMKMKSAGMTDSQKQAMMKKNHVKMMCKSTADAMGAHMMGSKM